MLRCIFAFPAQLPPSEAALLGTLVRPFTLNQFFSTAGPSSPSFLR